MTVTGEVDGADTDAAESGCLGREGCCGCWMTWSGVVGSCTLTVVGDERITPPPGSWLRLWGPGWRMAICFCVCCC